MPSPVGTTEPTLPRLGGWFLARAPARVRRKCSSQGAGRREGHFARVKNARNAIAIDNSARQFALTH